MGRKVSDETKKKMSESQKLRDHNIGIQNCKQYNERTSKRIAKLDINGNIIKLYNSISETVKKEKLDRSGLSTYLNRKSRKFYKGSIYKVINN